MLSLLFSAFTLSNGVPVVPAPSEGLPAKAPKAVGMSAARLAKIDHVVERGIRAGGFPGAAVVVGRRGASVWEKGFGRLSWGSDAPAVVPDKSIYDLASLTKVVATTTAAMILFDQKRLRLDAPVWQYIPAFSGGDKDRVTVRMLLEHRSGLPAGRDLWRIARSPWEARSAVIATNLAFKPGQYVEYSDIGADLLGFVVEAAAGMSLDRFLESRVYGPLGMTDTFFRPDGIHWSRIAPTELNPPRGYPVRGEVHDENAFALGGVAGHAGLFSTAADLSIFAQMMLNGGVYDGVRVVADSTIDLFTRRSARTRALGWDTCANNGSCGKYLSARAYGHTGFTGTSLWIDPERDMFVILLTNRVHAARAKRPATVIADVRADLADAAALAVLDGPEGPLAMPKAFRADKAVGWNPVIKKKPVLKKKPVVRKKPVAKKASGKSTTSSVRKAPTSKAKVTPKRPTTSRVSSTTTRTVSTKAATTKKPTVAPSKSARKPAAKSKSPPARKPTTTQR